MQNNTLCAKPNQHARPAGMEVFSHGVIFHGYQEFFLTKHQVRALADDHSLRKKVKLLSKFFQPKHLKGRTILDLGANSAFYCFWALQEQAESATAVDIDNEYLDMVKKAKDYLGFESLEIVRANVADWDTPADVVIALALVHWVYSSTALFGSLDTVIEKLSLLTNYMLIVEWIAPDDPAIQFFHHIDWNKNISKESYTLENFEKALLRYFRKVEIIGDISSTRRLYAAYHTENVIDLSCPLPLLYSKENLLSSRLLAVEEGIEYWSCIYEKDRKIYKQASLDLAIREALFLSDFQSDYFPRVLGYSQEDNYSVVVLEKIIGEPLKSVEKEIASNSVTTYEFICDCLEILDALKKSGILHRDIRMDNIVVRDKKPVLLDFGWAWSDNKPYLTPRGLGDKERPPDGVYCDVYSMGKVLEQLCRLDYPNYMEVINLMIESDSYLRIVNLDLLRILFALANKKGKIE